MNIWGLFGRRNPFKLGALCIYLSACVLHGCDGKEIVVEKCGRDSCVCVCCVCERESVQFCRPGLESLVFICSENRERRRSVDVKCN